MNPKVDLKLLIYSLLLETGPLTFKQICVELDKRGVRRRESVIAQAVKSLSRSNPAFIVAEGGVFRALLASQIPASKPKPRIDLLAPLRRLSSILSKSKKNDINRDAL